MQDPTISSSGSGVVGALLVAIASSVVGHQFGPIVTVIVAATVGALVSLSEVATSTRMEALTYVAKYVGMAIFASSAIAAIIEHVTGVPAIEVLAMVALLIGWIGNRWDAIRVALVSGLSTIVNSRRNDQ